MTGASARHYSAGSLITHIPSNIGTVAVTVNTAAKWQVGIAAEKAQPGQLWFLIFVAPTCIKICIGITPGLRFPPEWEPSYRFLFSGSSVNWMRPSTPDWRVNLKILLMGSVGEGPKLQLFKLLS